MANDVRLGPTAPHDDAAGVTAAFNVNVLTRINREFGGHFDLNRFRHVARWNDVESRIEMHLASTVAREATYADREFDFAVNVAVSRNTGGERDA